MKTKLYNLTVEELKDIIREVVREEMIKNKVNDFPPFIPFIPCYRGFDYMDYQITYTDRTEMKK